MLHCLELDTIVAHSLMVISDGSRSVEQPASHVRDVKPRAQHQGDKSTAAHQGDKSTAAARKAVKLTPPTPLYNKFTAELEPVVENRRNGDAFMLYMANCCFKGKLLTLDKYGEPNKTRVPLSVKMEEFFQIARTQRDLHQQRLRCRIRRETFHMETCRCKLTT